MVFRIFEWRKFSMVSKLNVQRHAALDPPFMQEIFFQNAHHNNLYDNIEFTQVIVKLSATGQEV